jgi:hypothetical protein
MVDGITVAEMHVGGRDHMEKQETREREESSFALS